jgi:hypothetical protein
MSSRYLESKIQQRVNRAMTVMPVVQMVLRIVILGLIFLGFKLSCDFLVQQTAG